MKNIPGGMISGLSEDVLQFVTNESSERYVHEIYVSEEFMSDVLSEEQLLPVLNTEQEEQLRAIDGDCQSKITQMQTKDHVQKFKIFFRKI